MVCAEPFVAGELQRLSPTPRHGNDRPDPENAPAFVSSFFFPRSYRALRAYVLYVSLFFFFFFFCCFQGSDERVSRQRKACARIVTALARSRARAADETIALLRWRLATAAATVAAAAPPHPPNVACAGGSSGDGKGAGSSGGGGEGESGGGLCALSPVWTVGASGTGTGALEALRGQVETARLGAESLAKQHEEVLEDSRCFLRARAEEGREGGGGGGMHSFP